MFAVVCVEKGVLFVFGSLMAFTTRKVSFTFNESQGISLSIYNVCFTIGIVSPIIVVVGAVGDVLTLLLVFALLWIAYFTGSILFVPKLMTIYFHTNGKEEVNNSVISASSSSGFQFVSLASFSTLPLLLSYLAALKKHVDQVEARVAKMRNNKSSTASPSTFVSPTQSSRPANNQQQGSASAVSTIPSPHVLSASRSHSQDLVLQTTGAANADDRTVARRRTRLATTSGSWVQHASTQQLSCTVGAVVERNKEEWSTAEELD